MLLPDENREVLQILLYFLSDVTAAVKENQMTPTNLAVCLAPSLFHLNTLKRENSSPRVMQRKQSLGKPDQKDLNENLAATQGLGHMIAECKKLFQIPEEMSRCRNSYTEQDLRPLSFEDLGQTNNSESASYHSYIQDCMDDFFKEIKDKFKGWVSCPTPEPAELAYKKVCEGPPLRLWKSVVEISATPEEVLNRIIKEQHLWDEDLLDAKVIETLDSQTDVYQFVQNSMAPHPARDYVILRGHKPDWYTKAFGHLCAAEVVRIRDSFLNQNLEAKEATSRFVLYNSQIATLNRKLECIAVETNVSENIFILYRSLANMIRCDAQLSALQRLPASCQTFAILKAKVAKFAELRSKVSGIPQQLEINYMEGKIGQKNDLTMLLSSGPIILVQTERKKNIKVSLLKTFEIVFCEAVKVFLKSIGYSRFCCQGNPPAHQVSALRLFRKLLLSQTCDTDQIFKEDAKSGTIMSDYSSHLKAFKKKKHSLFKHDPAKIAVPLRVHVPAPLRVWIHWRSRSQQDASCIGDEAHR
ncbi:hypothetical protein L345_10953, partial [Ophiophagus hannah]